MFVRLFFLLTAISGFISCNDSVTIEMYRLINFDIIDDKFYIRGVSLVDSTDTFTQVFTIIEKSWDGCCDHPKNATYRANLFQFANVVNDKLSYQDTFAISIDPRSGDYFGAKKEYWFKCDIRHKKVIAWFRKENCIGSFYFYYLRI